ncbi:MAG: hypothetical protein AB1324_07400 [Candidatus Micrarchaeota archaeon]
MEYQQKLLIIIAVLMVAVIYFAFTSPSPAPQVPANESNGTELLLLKGANFGKGLTDYVYSYYEVSDGYKTTYTMAVNGERRMIEILNPLSTKKVYLLPNETVLCIRYPVNETCSSIHNDSELANYVSFVQTKFFNDTLIDRSVSNLKFLMERDYLRVEPEAGQKTVAGKACSNVSYVIDYTTITLDEAARFGIGSDSPRLFRLSACIDNETGQQYESTLAYADNKGMNHSRVISYAGFREGSNPIELPANITPGTAVQALRKEREQQVNLVACFTDKRDAEREGCVSDLALVLKRKDLCELAGSLRNRCLVRLVPLLKDQTICGSITDAGFKDDCYIELAGAYKDASYCANVKDEAKAGMCEEVAVPDTKPDTNYDIEDLVDQIDKVPDNESGISVTTNTSGTNDSTG